MLPRKIAFLPLQSRNGNRAFPLEKSDHRRHRMFRWYGDTNMDMAGHQMPFDDLALLLFCQRVKDRAELLAHLSEQHFSTPFGHEHNVILCSSILNEISFDRFQTCILSWWGHQATGRGFYSWNGQTFSSLTGRTSAYRLSYFRNPAASELGKLVEETRRQELLAALTQYLQPDGKGGWVVEIQTGSVFRGANGQSYARLPGK